MSGSGQGNLVQPKPRELAGVSVIANNVSELNVDVVLVCDGGVTLSRNEEQLMEKRNGRSCGTLREDFLT
ncbi:MAG: hypothetical protein AAF989_06740 [Planctomycetota bacterium]